MQRTGRAERSPVCTAADCILSVWFTTDTLDGVTVTELVFFLTFWMRDVSKGTKTNKKYPHRLTAMTSIGFKKKTVTKGE